MHIPLLEGFLQTAFLQPVHHFQDFLIVPKELFPGDSLFVDKNLTISIAGRVHRTNDKV